MASVDFVANGRPLGVEFVVAWNFLTFLARHGGELALPARVDPAASSPHGDAPGGGLPGSDADGRIRRSDSVVG